MRRKGPNWLVANRCAKIRYEDGGRGISIMDVKGSPHDGGLIMDFASYPHWVDRLENTDIYCNNERNRIKVAFTLSVLGIDVAYWIDHRYDLDAGHMTWQLDYDKHSDIDDSTGYWLVYAAPNRPGFTRVEYTVDLRLSSRVPKLVENLLANQGLDKATSGSSNKQSSDRLGRSALAGKWYFLEHNHAALTLFAFPLPDGDFHALGMWRQRIGAGSGGRHSGGLGNSIGRRAH